MNFQKIAVLALSVLSFSATADVPLTQNDLLGTWQIDKESMQSDGSGSHSNNSTWTFKADGTLEGESNESSDEHARVKQLRAVLNYSVENGKILKQAAPGRSKMETCVALEKVSNTMVLKCQSIYFFMTKK